MANPSFAWRNPGAQTSSAQAAPMAQTPAVSFGTRPGQGAYDYRQHLTYEPDLTTINDLLSEMTGRQLGFGLQLAPQREQALYDLLNTLNPANQTAQARSQFGSLLGASQDVGRTQAAGLGRAGYGSGVQAGAMLAARNQAARQGNQNLLNMTSPQAKAQNLSQMLSAIQGGTQPTALQGYMSAYGTEAQKNASEEKPSFLSSLLGIGGQLAGMGAFGGMGAATGASGANQFMGQSIGKGLAGLRFF